MKSIKKNLIEDYFTLNWNDRALFQFHWMWYFIHKYFCNLYRDVVYYKPNYVTKPFLGDNAPPSPRKLLNKIRNIFIFWFFSEKNILSQNCSFLPFLNFIYNNNLLPSPNTKKMSFTYFQFLQNRSWWIQSENLCN